MSDSRLDAIAAIIQEDIGQRGLRTDPAANLVTATRGDLAAACRSLAETPNPAVAVVTGFFIPTGQPPAGETDGPLGAVFLARALVPLDIRVVLVSDSFCAAALEAGLGYAGLRKRVPLVILPNVAEAMALPPAEYCQRFHERAGPLTHLIALERVGPSHTPESLQQQEGITTEAVNQFIREVPSQSYDRCHTMKGRDITARMSPAHHLFEAARRTTPALITIGIGDGGNEIGMGKVSWPIIRRNIPGGGLVACRVPVDHLIVCGVSNWGAYGLGAGVRLLRGQPPDPDLFDPIREEDLLRLMVRRGPLVDGVTGQESVSVDGLTFDHYAEPLCRLGELR